MKARLRLIRPQPPRPEPAPLVEPPAQPLLWRIARWLLVLWGLVALAMVLAQSAPVVSGLLLAAGFAVTLYGPR